MCCAGGQTQAHDLKRSFTAYKVFSKSVLLKKQKIYFLKQINEFTWEMWVPHVCPSGCNT